MYLLTNFLSELASRGKKLFPLERQNDETICAGEARVVHRSFTMLQGYYSIDYRLKQTIALPMRVIPVYARSCTRAK